MESSLALFDIKNAQVYRENNPVFDNLSLTINAGESTAIIGPNGAGKTTLLKLLSREIYPVVRENSHIKLFGREHVNIWQLRQQIGLVSHEFQTNYAAIATGLDVVLSAYFGSTGLYDHHRINNEQKTIALQLLAKLRLDDLYDKQYLKLSNGQQRRLLLARALIHQPSALIFDEPTNGLDMPAAFQLVQDIRNWCTPEHTLILVTHHIQEIIPEITRIIFLKNGKLIADGPKEELLSSHTISELYDTNILVSEQNGFYTAVPSKQR